MTAFANPAVDPAAVPPPGAEAAPFHAGLRVAATRGLRCRVFPPARAAAAATDAH